RRSRTSPSSAANLVSSILIRTCPCFTIEPSWIRISRTIPPSRLCTIWIWRDETTLPLPRLTSSSTAKCAQTTPVIISAMTAARRSRDVTGVASSDAARISLTKAKSDCRIFRRCLRLDGRPLRESLQLGENLIPGPVCDKQTLLKNQQAVDQRQQREAVSRYDDGHVAVRQNLQAFEKFCFAPRIEMRRWFVEKENLRFANECPREPDGLLLPSRQAPAAFRNRHVVAKRVHRSEPFDARKTSGFKNLLICRRREPEGNIVAQPAEKQFCVLEDETGSAAQIGRIILAQLHTFDQDAAFLGLVKSREQAPHSRLARARAPDDADALAGLNCKRDPVEGVRRRVWILESYVIENDRATPDLARQIDLGRRPFAFERHES